ncbi:phage holin family protein [Hahella sp. CR1]|uniref:HP1 family phage holin n=1 Tax=Hahella sp. CR1 TaxID=2992807 RepID=UPI002441520D|nr:holin [Hahella sp. CR1]MDG9666727.1 phage holin family protein [Hahella sp. CR1]
MPDKAASAAAYASSAVATLFGLSLSQVVALGGLLIAAATFVMNWYYKQKHLDLAREQASKQRNGVNQDEQPNHPTD